MEKCWEIEEKLPIPVKVLPNNNIEVGPMLMTYRRWQNLGDNLDEGIIKMRLERKATYGLKDISEGMIKYPNGVSYSQYQYVDGVCTFVSPSKKDTENWLKLYEGIVKKV